MDLGHIRSDCSDHACSDLGRPCQASQGAKDGQGLQFVGVSDDTHLSDLPGPAGIYFLFVDRGVLATTYWAIWRILLRLERPPIGFIT